MATLLASTRPPTALNPVNTAYLREAMLNRYSTMLFELKGGCRGDAQATRLYLQGVLVATASGFGYDKEGSCFAQLLHRFFPEELTALLKACPRVEGNCDYMRPGTMDYVLPGPAGTRIAEHLVLQGETGWTLHPMGGKGTAVACLEHITKHQLARVCGSQGTPIGNRDQLVLQPWPHYPIPHYMIEKLVEEPFFLEALERQK